MEGRSTTLSYDEADLASRVIYYFLDIYDSQSDPGWKEDIEKIKDLADKLAQV